ncbi:MAG TPA: PilZ domain-containing protein [Vicinamibacterales bacterium]
MRDRRVDARFSAEVVEGRVTLRPGCVVAVIDWSAGGALVQAGQPLRPGARVHVQVALERRTVGIAAHVLRCFVWSLDPHGVTYRGALKFEHRCEPFWASPQHAASGPVTRDRHER